MGTIIKLIGVLFFLYLLLGFIFNDWTFALIVVAVFCIFMILRILFGVYAQKEQQRQYVEKLKLATRENPLIGTNMDTLSGESFEEYCSDLLISIGFSDIELTKATGDNGIDIVAVKDGMRYGFQCKRYKSSVGVKAIQEAYAGASYYGCNVAAVITNSYFTKAAIEMANNISVELWDRDTIESIKNTIIESASEARQKQNGSDSDSVHRTEPRGVKVQRNTKSNERKSITDTDGNMLRIIIAVIAIGIIACVVAVVVLNSGQKTSTLTDTEYDFMTNGDMEEDTAMDSEIDSIDEEAETTIDENKPKPAHPEIWMREYEIQNTELGEADTVEYSDSFEAMDENHRHKIYKWEGEGSDFCEAKVEYVRHFSNHVDDIEKYADGEGYVSSVTYYDESSGTYVTEDEIDRHHEGIYE